MLRSSTLLRSHTWRALSRDTERQALKPIVAICPADDEEIGRCLAEGIAAIVLPNESPWLLAAAVHAAAARQLFVSPAVLTKHQRQLVDMINTPTCTQLAELTEREHDVLVCMAHGYSNSGIAKKLHITRATVGSHVLRILRKLGAANRTEAAAVAHKVGLVGTSSLDWEPGQGRTEAKSYPAPPVRTPARPMSSTAPAGATVRPRIPARRPAPQPTPGRISYP
ncbi:helix-turn-helix transcriptional regulator [Tamaricihabitans halophyticus]|nr:response regulator transcription factor [Tamaricihabitans halophyticus]